MLISDSRVMMKPIINISLLAFLSSCTINMSLANTEGSARDIIESSPANDVNSQTSAQIPLSEAPTCIRK